jgi:DUF3050 family protein
MEQVGAETRGIHTFLTRLRGGERIGAALTEAPVPEAAQQFVLATMEVVNTNRVHAIAAAFTFGREQAIPVMFMPIVEALDDADDRTATLITYLVGPISVTPPRGQRGPVLAARAGQSRVL